MADLDDGGHRFRAILAAGLTPLPPLSLALDVSGRMDKYSTANGTTDTNLYGEPRLTARFAPVAPTASVVWGAEADVRLVGAEAPSVRFAATSPSLRALLGVKIGDQGWFAAQLGFHLDRSAKAIPAPDALSTPDRLTLGASSSNAVPWGLGVSLPVGSGGTEVLGEASGDVLLGSDAPKLLESPMRLAAGARHPILTNLSLLFALELGLSKRPDPLPSDALIPIEPRVAGGLTVSWHFDSAGSSTSEPASDAEPKAERPSEPAKPPAPETQEVKTSAVTGTVVDEGGRPLADAKVILRRQGAPPQEERTFGNGGFEFGDVPEGPVELQVITPGFDEVTISIKPGEERTREIVLYPSVPAGQVRGRIRDLKGDPIRATITITPRKKQLEAEADGTFELELEPGRYKVRFEHPDFTPQTRFIKVQDRGVVILNIALTR